MVLRFPEPWNQNHWNPRTLNLWNPWNLWNL